jgi:hypothetical protein
MFGLEGGMVAFDSIEVILDGVEAVAVLWGIFEGRNPFAVVLELTVMSTELNAVSSDLSVVSVEPSVVAAKLGVMFVKLRGVFLKLAAMVRDLIPIRSPGFVPGGRVFLVALLDNLASFFKVR